MIEETIESIVDQYAIGHKGGVQCKCISGARGHLIAKLEAKIRTAIQQEREVCICAAVKYPNDLIVRGHRHADCFATAMRNYGIDNYKGAEQGFMTSQNRFVGRREAFALQKAAGIKSAANVGYEKSSGQLYSEDLY